MYVIEVIPFSVLPPQVPQVLSYYAEVDLPKGAVVEVPLHNRKVQAVVINASAVDDSRILVKKSAFQLKKITSVLSAEPQVSEYQFKLGLWLANEYLSPLGLALKATLPPFFLKKKYKAEIQALPIATRIPTPLGIICRARDVLKNLPEFVGQTLILVPEISYISAFTKKYPEAEITNSSIKNKDCYQIWQKVQAGEARIIIGTRQALFLPFHNLQTLVVIDPLHEFYKSDYSPKYNASKLAEYVARLYSAQLLLVSNLLGVENYIRTEKKELTVQDKISAWSSEPEIINLVAEMKQGYVGALSVPLKRQVVKFVKAGKKVLIFASRRGYGGIMVCKRCGFTANCPRCNIPMRVHQSLDKILICHHCSTNQSYPRFCANCHSSEIKPTGPAGSQKIFEELQKMMEFGQLDRVPTLILDADVTQNQTEEDEVMDTIRKPGPKIVIATAKIFSYIFEDSFGLVAIPQFDALSVSPDYQTTERLWYQLEKLADFNPERVVIQTYDLARVPREVITHNYSSLYTEESTNRQLLSYPPFSKIVKLTFTHRKGQLAVNAGRQLIEKLRLAATHLRIQPHIQISDSSPMFLSKEKDRYTFTVIVKSLPQNTHLRELIKYAPSGWLIDVDPRQII